MITPKAVYLFRHAVEIERDGAHELWEREGGCQRAYISTSAKELHKVLGLKSGNMARSLSSVTRTANCRPGWTSRVPDRELAASREDPAEIDSSPRSGGAPGGDRAGPINCEAPNHNLKTGNKH